MHYIICKRIFIIFFGCALLDYSFYYVLNFRLRLQIWSILVRVRINRTLSIHFLFHWKLISLYINLNYPKIFVKSDDFLPSSPCLLTLRDCCRGSLEWRGQIHQVWLLKETCCTSSISIRFPFWLVYSHQPWRMFLFSTSAILTDTTFFQLF
jgi:hypothetical protein